MNLTLQTIPSTLISEFLSNSCFDGVVLDVEHGCFNNETLYSCIQTITLCKKLCFVRFTDLNKQLVRMCLDADVFGIIFSTIEEINKCKEIIDFCTYPLYNGKRGCGLVRENWWGVKQLGINRPMIIGQIETKLGIDNLDDLLYFDKFLIGPFDLSNSLGCPMDWNSDLYKKYIKKIYDKIDINKLGIFLPTKDSIDIFLHTNAKLPIMVWGMDVDFLKSGIDLIKDYVVR